MEIFGIGIQEILFIMVLALVILGPKDIAQNGRKIGGWLRKIVMSDEWRVMRKTSDELRNLPNKLMREANPDLNMDEINREIFGKSEKNSDGYGTWARSKPIPTTSVPVKSENQIAPPQAETEPDSADSSIVEDIHEENS